MTLAVPRPPSPPAAGYLARAPAMGDEPRKAAAARMLSTDRAHRRRRAARPRAGCSSSAACSTRRASRCRTRRSPSPCGASSCSPAPVPKGLPGAGRPRGERRVGPVPARCGPHLVGPSREFGATALAPGYGVGWAELDPDDDRPSAEIRLLPEQVIEGRLFDVQGRPVPGAVVSVSAIWRALPPSVPAVEPSRTSSEGPYRWWGRVHDLPGWPKPATTDADGRFTLHGIGRGLHARLSVLDPRFAPQTIEVDTDAPAGVEDPEGGAPAGPDRHRPRDLCRHRPARRSCQGPLGRSSTRRSPAGRIRYLTAETDADGRFRVSVMPGDRPHVWAAAPEGNPYLRVGERPGMAQGGDRAGRQPGAAPRRPAPRQGHRGGHRSARGGRHGLLLPVRPASRPRRGERMGPDESRRLVRVRRRAAPRLPVGPGARRGLPAPGDQRRAVLRREPAARRAAVCACLPPL